MTLTVVATGILVASASYGADNGPVADASAKARHCRQVDVKLEPEGEGSAVHIRAWRVGCKKARRVVRHCIQGKVDDGWTAKVNASLTRIVLRSGNRQIAYTPAGGGGCVPV